ncbi:MAG: FkbM family methyltransferase [Gammaproteobacteria bacterium]
MAQSFLSRPPVALFAYNRRDHLESTVGALQRNRGASETHLTVFLDGARDAADAAGVTAAREYARTIDGFATVELREAPVNRGLARSIIDGVSELVERDGRVVVIEDDLVTAPGALDYFRFMLDRYAAQPNVFSVSAYSHPRGAMALPADYPYDVYFVHRMMCWGWATWRDRWRQADWEMADFDDFLASPGLVRAYHHQIGADSLGTLKRCVAGEKDVWACRWVYAHFKHGALCACPTTSLVDNIGLDGSGANCGTDHRLRNDLPESIGPDPVTPPYPFVDPRVLEAFMSVYDPRRAVAPAALAPAPASVPRRVLRFARRVLRAGVRRLRALPGALRRRTRRMLDEGRAGARRAALALPDRVFAWFGGEASAPLTRLGTQYGGWRVADGAVGRGDVVLSAGAGEDISFDVELRNRTGCEIHIIDPTPRAREHFDMVRSHAAEGQAAPINNSTDVFYDLAADTLAGLHFHPLGLWNKDEMQRFYMPANAAHVSHSIGNLHQTRDYFEADCRRLSSILDTIGTTRLAALKMDIEGAEYAVIRDLVKSRLRPRMLMIEFHAGRSEIEKKFKPKTMLHAALLRAVGYRLVARDGWDFVFERVA